MPLRPLRPTKVLRRSRCCLLLPFFFNSSQRLRWFEKGSRVRKKHLPDKPRAELAGLFASLPCATLEHDDHVFSYPILPITAYHSPIGGSVALQTSSSKCKQSNYQASLFAKDWIARHSTPAWPDFLSSSVTHHRNCTTSEDEQRLLSSATGEDSHKDNFRALYLKQHRKLVKLTTVAEVLIKL